MPGWLRGLLGLFSNPLADLWHAVVNLVNLLRGYEDAKIASLLRYAEYIHAELRSLSISYQNFTSLYYFPFVQYVVKTFHDVGTRVNNNYNHQQAEIDALSRRTDQNITVLSDGEKSDIAALIRWILSAIFGPLSALIARLFDWIDKYGNWMFSLLSDLSKFADLIMAFIWAGWFGLFKKYLPEIVKFIFMHWRSWFPSIIPILEDIIASLF